MDLVVLRNFLGAGLLSNLGGQMLLVEHLNFRLRLVGTYTTPTEPDVAREHLALVLFGHNLIETLVLPELVVIIDGIDCDVEFLVDDFGSSGHRGSCAHALFYRDRYNFG